MIPREIVLYAATAGKLLCAFLTLIVRSYMTSCPAEHMRQNGLALQRILPEFDKVRCTAFPTGRSMRITAPVTQTQRELLELLRGAPNGWACIGNFMGG